MIKNYAHLLYKTSNSNFGQAAHTASKNSKFGLNGKFTNHLASAGNFKANGLNTIVERERYLDNCKDWMDKIN